MVFLSSSRKLKVCCRMIHEPSVIRPGLCHYKNLVGFNVNIFLNKNDVKYSTQRYTSLYMKDSHSDSLPPQMWSLCIVN